MKARLLAARKRQDGICLSAICDWNLIMTSINLDQEKNKFLLHSLFIYESQYY